MWLKYLLLLRKAFNTPLFPKFFIQFSLDSELSIAIYEMGKFDELFAVLNWKGKICLLNSWTIWGRDPSPVCSNRPFHCFQSHKISWPTFPSMKKNKKQRQDPNTKNEAQSTEQGLHVKSWILGCCPPSHSQGTPFPTAGGNEFPGFPQHTRSCWQPHVILMHTQHDPQWKCSFLSPFLRLAPSIPCSPSPGAGMMNAVGSQLLWKLSPHPQPGAGSSRNTFPAVKWDREEGEDQHQGISWCSAPQAFYYCISSTQT